MNWTVTATGFAMVATTALLGLALMNRIGLTRRQGAGLLLAAAFASSTLAAEDTVATGGQASRIEAQFLQVRLFQVLREHEPDTYRQVIGLVEDGVAHKTPTASLHAEAQALIATIVGKRLVHAPDEVVLKYGRQVVEATAHLHAATDGEACFDYVHPVASRSRDFAALLGKDLADRQMNALADVLVSAAGQSRSIVHDDEIEGDLGLLMNALLAKYSLEEIEQMGDLADPGIDKRKFCSLLIDMYQGAAELPAPRDARLLRYLFQD